MSQPVELTDELVVDARTTAAISQRSIGGQIEYWAKLGRSVEQLLRGDRVQALVLAGEASLSKAVATVDSEDGRNRVREFLTQCPYPHFEAVADRPGWVCRIDEDGTRTIGRFVNREFVTE